MAGITRMNFVSLITHRMKEARCSVFIKHANPNKQGALRLILKKCEEMGPVKRIFPWQSSSGQTANMPKNFSYCLVEFEDRAPVQKMKKKGRIFPDSDAFNISARQFFFTSCIRDESKRTTNLFLPPNGKDKDKVEWHLLNNNGHQPLTNHLLMSASSVSEQMQIVYDCNKMTEVDSRLRFFICSDIEDTIQQLLPHCIVRPFGSSINGFGKKNTDLDMVVLNTRKILENFKNSEFYYLSKHRTDDTDNMRKAHKGILNTIGSVIRFMMPSYFNCQAILNARVPIIKFTHDATEIECDLCLENGNGLVMAELLYRVSTTDARVQPLVFTIQHWARYNGVTRSVASNHITNFMLILMVIHFLQQHTPAILPPLATLLPKSSEPQKGKKAADKTVVKSKNTESLDSLLCKFFKYYSEFPFNTNAISVCTGKIYPIVTQISAMEIKNPLDEEHNVCRNVGETPLRLFQKLCDQAYKNLAEKLVKSKNKEDWGLLTILQAELPVEKDILPFSGEEKLNGGIHFFGNGNGYAALKSNVEVDHEERLVTESAELEGKKALTGSDTNVLGADKDSNNNKELELLGNSLKVKGPFQS